MTVVNTVPWCPWGAARHLLIVVVVADWDNLVCYCECDRPPVILEAESLVMTIDEKVEKIVKVSHSISLDLLTMFRLQMYCHLLSKARS